MAMTHIFRAWGRSREAYEKLVVALHYEQQGNTRAAEREVEDAVFWLEQTAKALGLELVKPRPAKTVSMVVEAGKVQPGDILPGGWAVEEISHGPLDHQVRFTSGLATAFYGDAELVAIEREVRS